MCAWVGEGLTATGIATGAAAAADEKSVDIFQIFAPVAFLWTFQLLFFLYRSREKG